MKKYMKIHTKIEHVLDRYTDDIFLKYQIPVYMEI